MASWFPLNIRIFNNNFILHMLFHLYLRTHMCNNFPLYFYSLHQIGKRMIYIKLEKDDYVVSTRLDSVCININIWKISMIRIFLLFKSPNGPRKILCKIFSLALLKSNKIWFKQPSLTLSFFFCLQSLSSHEIIFKSFTMSSVLLSKNFVFSLNNIQFSVCVSLLALWVTYHCPVHFLKSL